MGTSLRKGKGKADSEVVIEGEEIMAALEAIEEKRLESTSTRYQVQDITSMSSLTIEKIKISGADPQLQYTRALPSGLAENCRLIMRPVPEQIEGAMQDLLGDAIEIIGLDEERWNDAAVISLSLKHEDGETGFVATLLNKEYWDGDTIAITANTPHLSGFRVDGVRGLKEKLIKIQMAAIAFIESQPKQLTLEDV